MTFLLKRVASTRYGTFGVLIDENNIPFVVTLERPWIDNKKGESCIPAGTYKCIRCRKSPDYGYQDSPKFGDVFQVYNVPGREKILIHRGNIEDDTHGCILIGEMFDPVSKKPGIASSAIGFHEFMDRLVQEDEFTLRIVEV